ncbi:MAG TPA: glycosyltransferase [Mycobacteriales bacterium]|nr:glycosyltransferase [Mycobacteriales bacterium]
MSRILVILDDTLGPKMAGPSIRAIHIALELATAHDVRLVSTRECTLTRADLDCRYVPYGRLPAQVEWAEVVVFQGYVMEKAPWLGQTDRVLVVDLYDPMHLEQLAMAGTIDDANRVANTNTSVRVLNEQMVRGDFFLCASEQQRHFWLGGLASVGRLNVTNYDADSSARSLIAVCPFGLPAESPSRTGPAIRGVTPGIGPDDEVILWAGGVYNWFDPLTLVRAMDTLRMSRGDVRLYFLGMAHPDPLMPQMRTAVDALELSGALGLTGRHVFFNEGWVPYAERQNYLLDADLGVSTHLDHLETTFSFRTRILDYLWAGLPIVSTRGDSFGDLIDREGLGRAVPEGDPGALAAALGELLADRAVAARCRENIARVRPRFTWEQALAPLLRFCEQPRRAADHLAGTAPVTGEPLAVPVTHVPSLRGDLRLVGEYYRRGGLTEIARRVRGRLARAGRQFADRSARGPRRG